MSLEKANKSTSYSKSLFNVQQSGTISPNPNYSMNRSPDGDQIIIEYISGGNGYIEIDGKTYFVKKGDCYILTNRKAHKIYADPLNPFARKQIILSGKMAFDLIDFYFLGKDFTIVQLDISDDLDEINKLAKFLPHKNMAVLSDFSLISKKDGVNLWKDISLADWKQWYWNKKLKESTTSRYGGFALENYEPAWQNLYTELKGLEAHTEYTLSFSVMTNRIHKLEVFSIDENDSVSFKNTTVLLNRSNTRSYTSLPFPDTDNNHWTDITFTFTTNEVKGVKYYFNLHYGERALSSKDSLILFHRILNNISKVINNAAPSEGKANLIDQIYLYIKEQAATPITLTEIAKHFNISPSHLDRIFKKAFGISPYQYYLECKVKSAKPLLKAPELSIEQISEQLNFSSRSHFEKTFLKITGETPAAYRKRKSV